MRFCIGLRSTAHNEKGPQGALLRIRSGRGRGLDAQGGRAAGGEEAEEQQEGRDEAIEVTFEVRERHDTHLEFRSGTPGERGCPFGQLLDSTI
jgi:hypothetical protein